MEPLILAIDQGTTGTTALLVREGSLGVAGKATREFRQRYPGPGRVEHDLGDVWGSVEGAVRGALGAAGARARDVAAVGVANQRETVCAFDRGGGGPLHRALVWQDKRTAGFCAENARLTPELRERTGLPLDPYFAGTKMRWLLDHAPRVRAAAEDGSLGLGTVDTWLVHRLTGGERYTTDASNASRTLLMDLRSGRWDRGLGDLLGVDPGLLPEITDSFGDLGETRGLGGLLPDGVPIRCVLGDQQAALLGQAGSHRRGAAKCTYGTGSFIVMNTGEEPLRSGSGLLATVAHRRRGRLTYALEGGSYVAGAAVGWLRDGLGVIGSAAEVEELAAGADPEETRHVLMLPFFSGMGPPHWKPGAKAALWGMTRDTGRAHVARAALEGIALSIDDVLRAFARDTGAPLGELRVDGGASANDLLMGIQATVSDLAVVRPRVIETTAYGAALGALVAAGREPGDLARAWERDREFRPDPALAPYLRGKRALWDEVLERCYGAANQQAGRTPST